MDGTLDLRTLRRRMGWTSSDLARRLNVKTTDIEVWEKGQPCDDREVLTRIEFLLRQADMCSEEVRHFAIAENFLEDTDLIQCDVGHLSRQKTEK